MDPDLPGGPRNEIPPGLVIYFNFMGVCPTLLERLAGTGVPIIYDELTTCGVRRPNHHIPPGVLVGPCPWGLVHRQPNAIIVVSSDEAHCTGESQENIIILLNTSKTC